MPLSLSLTLFFPSDNPGLVGVEAVDLRVGILMCIGICKKIIHSFLSVSECQLPEGKVKNCIG